MNDAIAGAVPMLLIPEPGHWQVETIRMATVDEGYAQSIPYPEFRRNPVEALDERIRSMRPVWEHVRNRMKQVLRGRERSIVEQILRKTEF